MPSSFDVMKHPDLDILVAIFLYPGSTYKQLLERGFERFQKSWDTHILDFTNKGLVEKSPEGGYSLTKKGECFMARRYNELDPSIFSRIKKSLNI